MEEKEEELVEANRGKSEVNHKNEYQYLKGLHLNKGDIRILFVSKITKLFY